MNNIILTISLIVITVTGYAQVGLDHINNDETRLRNTTQCYIAYPTDEIVIKFNTLTGGAIKFVVYSMLGEVMLSEEITSQVGPNNYRFDTNLSCGMYVYTIRHNKGGVFTNRMIVEW
jgi:hypothetical protein